jgi:dolichol kinase
MCFIIYTLHQTSLVDKPFIWFYLPVMIMATADPLAAIVGQKWAVKKYKIGNETKSFLGSTVFFITAFLLSLILYHLLYSQKNIGFSVVASLLLISLVSTFTEAISRNGLDNLTIPLSSLIAMELINYKFFIFS